MMNTQIQEALKMAGYDLDGVIIDVEKFDGFDDVCLQTIKRVRSVIAQALEQPAIKESLITESAQDPVAWMDKNNYVFEKESDIDSSGIKIPLYTHPHQWQGLTDDEIAEIVGEPVDVMYSGDYEAYRAIEAKLKEKNHG